MSLKIAHRFLQSDDRAAWLVVGSQFVFPF